MDEPNPFISEDEVGEVASVAYRYRKWDLDGGVVLVARCEHDAVTGLDEALLPEADLVHVAADEIRIHQLEISPEDFVRRVRFRLRL